MRKRTKYAQTMYLYTGYESLRFIKKKKKEQGKKETLTLEKFHRRQISNLQ